MQINKIAQITQEQTKELPHVYAVWLAQALMRETDNYTKPSPIDEDDMDIIVDWMEKERPSLDINILDAKERSRIWSAQEQYKTHNVVYKFNDGWEIVKLSYKDIASENFIMDLDEKGLKSALNEKERDGGTIGDYWSSDASEKAVESGEYLIYSLRDPDNNPHATIEILTNKKTLTVIEIFSYKDLEKIKETGNWTSYRHPHLDKIKQFFEWLKSQGYQFQPLPSDEDVELKDLANTELTNEYDLPLAFSNIGGTENYYYDNLISAYFEGEDGAYWYKRNPEKTVNALIQYAVNNNELGLLELAYEGYSYKATNKNGKEYTEFESLNDWANEAWFDAEEHIQFENPKPDEDN